ncbi:glycosyltransferase family 4 protein [Saccharospirillum mangrovi]|uniref:glycosyltransferase family 4 protein n=1 Tax=Saccharospirillum mangrovi TaxID=2161747 RepID=UPI000D3CAD2C|nr:glycosyltransferase family 4 protein [Saccharospirillum mangrovi]
MSEDLKKRVLILSDLHHRISGVSASIRAMIPRLQQEFDLFFVAKRPAGNHIAQSILSLYRLLKHWNHDYDPVWHVRRNNEMTWGILFRWLVCPRLKLVFTSAAIRTHSPWPRFLISKMDAVIATSQTAAALVPHVKAIVPHGVDIARFATTTDQPVDYPWHRYSVVIGIVGRVRPEKGTDLFSQALCRVLTQYPDACAVIVGKTTRKYRPLLRQMREEWRLEGIAQRVFVMNEVDVDAMPAVYQSLDIVCAPARYEGFGLVPIEAMVSGAAIIASRTGAYEDMILPGINGELIECNNLDQLDNALRKLLSNPSLVAAYQAQGQQRVVQQFSLDAEVAGVMDVYSSFWR